MASTLTEMVTTVRTTLQAAGLLPTTAQVEEIARQVMWGEPYPAPPAEVYYPPPEPPAPALPPALQQITPYLPYIALGIAALILVKK